MKNLIYLIILTVTFAVSAVAQVIEAPVEPVLTTKVNLSGVQSSEGKVDSVNNMRMGNAFVLNGADGDLSYHFTMSMDYSAAQPDFEIGNQVMSGTWNVTVYKNNTYFGSMFGEISTGTIRWYANQPGSRDTEVQLAITGGMDGYADQAPLILEKFLAGFSKLAEEGQTIMDATIELPISERK